MTGEAADLEALLRRALVPVEPPEELSARLESTLVELTELAADELDAWELRAMGDPRNWARPAAALVVGGGAAAALVVVRARRRNGRRRGAAGVLGTLRDAAGEARRLAAR